MVKRAEKLPLVLLADRGKRGVDLALSELLIQSLFNARNEWGPGGSASRFANSAKKQIEPFPLFPKSQTTKKGPPFGEPF